MRLNSHFSLNAPSTKPKSVMLQQALGTSVRACTGVWAVYDNDELFDQLSGAGRTLLELKCGKKDRKGGVGTGATSEAGIEGAQPAGNVGGSLQLRAAHSEFSPPISDSSFSSSPSVLGFFQGISPHSKRQDALAGWA